MNGVNFKNIKFTFFCYCFCFIGSAFSIQKPLDNVTIFDKLNTNKIVVLSESYNSSNKDPKIGLNNIKFLENKKLNITWIGDEYLNMVIGGDSSKLSKTADWAKVIAFQQFLPPNEFLIWFNNEKPLKETASITSLPKDALEKYNIIVSQQNDQEFDIVIIKKSDWSSSFLELAFNSYDCQHYKTFTFSQCLKKLYAENVFSANENIFIYEKK